MTAHVRSAPLSPSRPRPAARPWRWIEAAFATFRHRHQLSGLDSRMLNDIGLTPEEAENEANRPFWDVPDWWR